MQTLLQPEHSIEARELLNLSQAKVAKETGINRAYLSQFENGKRILRDAENDSLYHYYDKQGLDVDALGQSISHDQQTPELMTNLTPVYSVNPRRIKDGIVISRDLDSETVETLLVEYYELDSQIEEAAKQPVVRGLFGLYHDDTMEKALPLLLDCYRQRQIKSALQGRESLEDAKPAEGSDIKKIADFLSGYKITPK